MAKAITKTDSMVKIRAPLARVKEQDLIISVNGINYSIPQDGKEYEVPDFVAYEYNRSEEARKKFYETQAELQEQSMFA